ncbi:MAG: FecCD family ABC transporter permease [bacterium]
MPTSEDSQWRMIRRWCLWTGGLLSLLILVSAFSLSFGSARIPVMTVAGHIRAFLFSGEARDMSSTIVLRIRLPRVILGLFIGGALSVAGVLFQGLFHNPLVEPYTLGVSGGAALGVSLFILCGWHFMKGISLLPLAGFLGAVLSILLVYGLSVKRGVPKTNTMLLAGVMISFISSSAIMLLMATSSHLQRVHNLLFWIMGSLQENNLTLIRWTCGLITLAVLASFFLYRELNILALGDEEALHLGIPVERIKKVIFLLGSVLTGLAVSISGMIGFVGLIVPHLMRLLSGSDHRLLILSSFLAGGIFLILADTLARTIISPLELPVGVITGLLGGSLFVYFLWARS